MNWSEFPEYVQDFCMKDFYGLTNDYYTAKLIIELLNSNLEKPFTTSEVRNNLKTSHPYTSCEDYQIRKSVLYLIEHKILKLTDISSSREYVYQLQHSPIQEIPIIDKFNKNYGKVSDIYWSIAGLYKTKHISLITRKLKEKKIQYFLKKENGYSYTKVYYKLDILKIILDYNLYKDSKISKKELLKIMDTLSKGDSQIHLENKKHKEIQNYIIEELSKNLDTYYYSNSDIEELIHNKPKCKSIKKSIIDECLQNLYNKGILKISYEKYTQRKLFQLKESILAGIIRIPENFEKERYISINNFLEEKEENDILFEYFRKCYNQGDFMFKKTFVQIA